MPGTGQVVVVPERQHGEEHGVRGETRRPRRTRARCRRSRCASAESASTATSFRPTGASSRHPTDPGRTRSRSHRRRRSPAISDRNGVWFGPGSPDHDDVAERGELGGDVGRHRPVVERADPIGDEVGDGRRGPDEMPNLGVSMGAQCHHRDDADVVQREIERDELRAVWQLHDDAILRPQAQTERDRSPGASPTESALHR